MWGTHDKKGAVLHLNTMFSTKLLRWDCNSHVMGYVLREAGKLTVNADTCSVIYDDKRLEQLQLAGKAVRRRAVGIVIYSEQDFDAFYNKHCVRIPNDNNPFTILVIDKVNVPSRREVRALLEEALKRKNTKFEKSWISSSGKIVASIEQSGWFSTPRNAIRTFLQGRFFDEPRKGSFRCRDVHAIFPSQLEDIYNDGHIPQLELQNLEGILDFARAKMCEYAIAYVWIIGHIDVI